MSRPTLLQFFFSAEGRIGRLAFWLAIGLLVAVLATIDSAFSGWLQAVAAVPVKLALLVAGACVTSKRLHDRGRSGWWWIVSMTAVWLMWPAPRGLVGGLALLVIALTAVELGVRPGQPRFNRFGPPPGERIKLSET